MEEIGNINEDELDISNIDRLQIKAIKEMSERLGKKSKQDFSMLCQKQIYVIIASSNLIG